MLRVVAIRYANPVDGSPLGKGKILQKRILKKLQKMRIQPSEI